MLTRCSARLAPHNTELKGGAITSTQKAINEAKNSFSSAGPLTTSDIQNQASYSASSVGINLGTGFDPSGKLTPQGTSAGIGQDSGNASSTTAAAISGIAGNKEARTGDAQTGIGKIFDADKVQKNIDAQVQITQTFGREASKAVGDYADSQMKNALALKLQASQESDKDKRSALEQQAQDIEDKWGSQGTARLAAHTLIGGLTGGLSGAAGAAAGTLTAPAVAAALQSAGIDGTLAQAITAAASTAVGAAVGGTAGAAAAGNEVVNNFLNHTEATRRAKLMEQKLACKDDSCATALQTEIDKLNTLDAWRDQKIAQACQQPGSALCGAWTNAIQVAAQSYTGKDSSNPLVSAERSSVLNDAFKYQQANNNPFLNGVGQGLLQLTPLGLAAGAGVGAYELTTLIINNGVADTAVALIKGIANLPSNIVAGLNSADPAVRGEALVNALSLSSVATVVTAKLGTLVLENAFTGPVAGGLIAQRGGVKVGESGSGLIPPGKLIGSTEALTPAEQSFIGEMVAGGKTVQVIPSTNAGRTADFLIDGTKYELKTMTNVVNQTSDGLSKSLSSTIMDVRGQSGNIIIDARGQAGMTPEIAERGIGRAFGNDSRSGSKIQGVTVITSQGTVHIPRKP